MKVIVLELSSVVATCDYTCMSDILSKHQASIKDAHGVICIEKEKLPETLVKRLIRRGAKEWVVRKKVLADKNEIEKLGERYMIITEGYQTIAYVDDVIYGPNTEEEEC